MVVLLLCVCQAYGLMLDGSYSEALQELEPLQDYRELHVAVLAAMLYSHEHSASFDADITHNMLRRLETLEQNASERALVLAATLYWHFGESKHLRKSRELVARSASETSAFQFLPRNALC